MRREIHEVLAELEADGTLSAEQRRRVAEALARRGEPAHDHSRRLITVLASFGALLFGAGVLYLVGYNWAALGRATKLALVFGAWIALHAAAFAASERPDGHPLLGRALSLLGMLWFGAAIFLVAQVYNLSPHHPWGMLAWWALNVPLFLWLRSRSAQALVTGLFLVWAFWQAGVWIEDQAELQHWRYGPLGEFQLASALGPLFAALAALAGTGRDPRWSALWRQLGIVSGLFGAYLLGFHDLHGGVPEARSTLLAATPAFAALLLGLLLLVAALLRGARGRILHESVALVALALLLLAVLLAAREWMPLLANLLLLAALLALVAHGSRARELGLVNLALGFFALAIVTRYVEYLWDKLQGAYAFLGAGALLLGLGWLLERRRRAWKARITEAAR